MYRVLFECDQCGKQADTDDEENIPEGWLRITDWTEQLIGILCDGCSKDLWRWFQKEGA